jgi:ubiquinone/menaquinone biosynthesis C-methylase UbiE
LQEAGIENVTLIKGDLRSIPYPDKFFDPVSLYCTVQSLEDFEKPGHTLQVFGEAYRVLKPRGKILIVNDAEPPADCPELQYLAWEYVLWEVEYATLAGDTHELYYSSQEIVQMLKDVGFQKVDWMWIELKK